VATATGAYATAALVKARLFAAGVTDTADDTLIGTICDQVNQFIESPHGTGRVLAPINSATYLIDGNGLRRLYFQKGIRAVTELKVGDYTGDTLDILAATDYYLRPSVYERKSGWPAEYIELSDMPAGDHTVFGEGYETVSLTCTAGWAAIPDDIIDVALTTAVRAWGARQNGQADIVGNDDTGEPLVSRYVAGFHWATIRAYRVKKPAVVG
jgi:hypothetical protein